MSLKQGGNKSTRKSLKTLQQTTISRENLIGKHSSKGSKHRLSQESLIDLNVKQKNLLTYSKEIQVNLDNTISADDLTNKDGPSEKYWEILAGKRQVALQEVLEENHKLQTKIDELKQELEQYKQMLEEANSFVEVIKEELANTSRDDTGIDVNDVSAVDEDEKQK